MRRKSGIHAYLAQQARFFETGILECIQHRLHPARRIFHLNQLSAPVGIMTLSLENNLLDGPPTPELIDASK